MRGRGKTAESQTQSGMKRETSKAKRSINERDAKNSLANELSSETQALRDTANTVENVMNHLKNERKDLVDERAATAQRQAFENSIVEHAHKMAMEAVHNQQVTSRIGTETNVIQNVDEIDTTNELKKSILKELKFDTSQKVNVSIDRDPSYVDIIREEQDFYVNMQKVTIDSLSKLIDDIKKKELRRLKDQLKNIVFKLDIGNLNNKSLLIDGKRDLLELVDKNDEFNIKNLSDKSKINVRPVVIATEGDGETVNERAKPIVLKDHFSKISELSMKKYFLVKFKQILTKFDINSLVKHVFLQYGDRTDKIEQRLHIFNNLFESNFNELSLSELEKRVKSTEKSLNMKYLINYFSLNNNNATDSVGDVRGGGGVGRDYDFYLNEILSIKRIAANNSSSSEADEYASVLRRVAELFDEVKCMPDYINEINIDLLIESIKKSTTTTTTVNDNNQKIEIYDCSPIHHQSNDDGTMYVHSIEILMHEYNESSEKSIELLSRLIRCVHNMFENIQSESANMCSSKLNNLNNLFKKISRNLLIIKIEFDKCHLLTTIKLDLNKIKILIDQYINFKHLYGESVEELRFCLYLRERKYLKYKNFVENVDEYFKLQEIKANRQIKAINYMCKHMKFNLLNLIKGEKANLFKEDGENKSTIEILLKNIYLNDDALKLNLKTVLIEYLEQLYDMQNNKETVEEFSNFNLKSICESLKTFAKKRKLLTKLKLDELNEKKQECDQIIALLFKHMSLYTVTKGLPYFELDLFVDVSNNNSNNSSSSRSKTNTSSIDFNSVQQQLCQFMTLMRKLCDELRLTKILENNENKKRNKKMKPPFPPVAPGGDDGGGDESNLRKGKNDEEGLLYEFNQVNIGPCKVYCSAVNEINDLDKKFIKAGKWIVLIKDEANASIHIYYRENDTFTIQNVSISENNNVTAAAAAPLETVDTNDDNIYQKLKDLNYNNEQLSPTNDTNKVVYKSVFDKIEKLNGFTNYSFEYMVAFNHLKQIYDQKINTIKCEKSLSPNFIKFICQDIDYWVYGHEIADYWFERIDEKLLLINLLIKINTEYKNHIKELTTSDLLDNGDNDLFRTIIRQENTFESLLVMFEKIVSDLDIDESDEAVVGLSEAIMIRFYKLLSNYDFLLYQPLSTSSLDKEKLILSADIIQTVTNRLNEIIKKFQSIDLTTNKNANKLKFTLIYEILVKNNNLYMEYSKVCFENILREKFQFIFTKIKELFIPLQPPVEASPSSSNDDSNSLLSLDRHNRIMQEAFDSALNKLIDETKDHCYTHITKFYETSYYRIFEYEKYKSFQYLCELCNNLIIDYTISGADPQQLTDNYIIVYKRKIKHFSRQTLLKLSELETQVLLEEEGAIVGVDGISAGEEFKRELSLLNQYNENATFGVRVSKLLIEIFYEKFLKTTNLLTLTTAAVPTNTLKTILSSFYFIIENCWDIYEDQLQSIEIKLSDCIKEYKMNNNNNNEETKQLIEMLSEIQNLFRKKMILMVVDRKEILLINLNDEFEVKNSIANLIIKDDKDLRPSVSTTTTFNTNNNNDNDPLASSQLKRDELLNVFNKIKELLDENYAQLPFKDLIESYNELIRTIAKCSPLKCLETFRELYEKLCFILKLFIQNVDYSKYCGNELIDELEGYNKTVRESKQKQNNKDDNDREGVNRVTHLLENVLKYDGNIENNEYRELIHRKVISNFDSYEYNDVEMLDKIELILNNNEKKLMAIEKNKALHNDYKLFINKKAIKLLNDNYDKHVAIRETVKGEIRKISKEIIEIFYKNVENSDLLGKETEVSYLELGLEKIKYLHMMNLETQKAHLEKVLNQIKQLQLNANKKEFVVNLHSMMNCEINKLISSNKADFSILPLSANANKFALSEKIDQNLFKNIIECEYEMSEDQLKIYEILSELFEQVVNIYVQQEENDAGGGGVSDEELNEFISRFTYVFRFVAWRNMTTTVASQNNNNSKSESSETKKRRERIESATDKLSAAKGTLKMKLTDKSKTSDNNGLLMTTISDFDKIFYLRTHDSQFQEDINNLNAQLLLRANTIQNIFKSWCLNIESYHSTTAVDGEGGGGGGAFQTCNIAKVYLEKVEKLFEMTNSDLENEFQLIEDKQKKTISNKDIVTKIVEEKEEGKEKEEEMKVTKKESPPPMTSSNDQLINEDYDRSEELKEKFIILDHVADGMLKKGE